MWKTCKPSNDECFDIKTFILTTRAKTGYIYSCLFLKYLTHDYISSYLTSTLYPTDFYLVLWLNRCREISLQKLYNLFRINYHSYRIDVISLQIKMCLNVLFLLNILLINMSYLIIYN